MRWEKGKSISNLHFLFKHQCTCSNHYITSLFTSWFIQAVIGNRAQVFSQFTLVCFDTTQTHIHFFFYGRNKVTSAALLNKDISLIKTCLGTFTFVIVRLNSLWGGFYICLLDFFSSIHIHTLCQAPVASGQGERMHCGHHLVHHELDRGQ